MEIETALLGVPASVGGYENFEFQEYANAIGAMFRSNKEFERINLLEVDAAAGKSAAGAGFGLALVAAAGISAVIVFAVFLFFRIQIDNYNKQIQEINDWIASEDTQHKLTLVDDAQTRVNKLKAYNGQIALAYKNFETKPEITSEVLAQLQENTVGTNTTITQMAFASGKITINCTSRDSTSPSAFVQKMVEQDIFKDINYTGYSFSSSEGGPAGYTFDVTFKMAPQIPEPITEAEIKAANEAAAAAAAAGTQTPEVTE
jgi:type IV pilus assembly protein PilM